jgi:hypothetical protein
MASGTSNVGGRYCGAGSALAPLLSNGAEHLTRIGVEELTTL